MSAPENGRRDRETIEAPDTVDLAAVDAAEIMVVRLAFQRRLPVREALKFSRMLEHRRRAIGDRTLEQQMRELEAARKKPRGEDG